MLQIPGYQIKQLLHDSIQSRVYRAEREGDGEAVILKVLAEDYPSPQRIARFRQEYEIALQLADVEGVVKVFGLERVQNRYVMIQEDFGGRTLREYVQGNERLPLSKLLGIMVGIVTVLGEIHQHHVIHKDINPGNILYNPAEDEVRIIDFGLATVLSRETTTFRHPNVLAGTLAYISPEQTGRMNRDIDYRTDYYSLGATFYEMLAGQVPFLTDDPMEIIHSHIAQEPAPITVLKPLIPEMVSQIVLKLLAKNAEDRYQSAYGLKEDLGICLEAWQEKQAVPVFRLGGKDQTNQFQIPQKLYGREREIEQLLAAFERITVGGHELMLVTGPSGIGKSVLVREIYKPITGQRGYFIAGKFDQLQRDKPYAPLIQAFQALIRQLLTESEADIRRWREKLQGALAPNGQVIVDVIPEMALVIGEQEGVPSLPPAEAQSRFRLVLQNMMRVFTAEEHPVVLFVDDLQWADSSSLDLLQLLLTDAETHHLFVIGAYRDNEVNQAHRLMTMLGVLQQKQVAIQRIELAPLKLAHVVMLLEETLQAEDEVVWPLAQLVLDKTGGTPFFVTEFLKSLYQEKLISFDFQEGGWQWDLGGIQTQMITDNVVSLMSDKVRKLPAETQAMLQLAACIGNQFELRTLAVVRREGVAVVAEALWPALIEGLIIPLSEQYQVAQIAILDEGDVASIVYKFAHDRIQQATYDLIAVDERGEMHYRIGKEMWREASGDGLYQYLFDIVNHLNAAQVAGVVVRERQEVVGLNLEASRKAKSSAAYEAAYQYASTALDLLPETAWEDSYDLALGVYTEVAETAYLNGHWEKIEPWVAAVQTHGKNALDKVRIYEVTIGAQLAANQPNQAARTALEALRLLGIKIPIEPHFGHVVSSLMRTEILMVGRKIERLASMTAMSLADKLAAMRIMSTVSAAAYIANPQLFALLALKMVRLSVRYGPAPASAQAYATYALILTSNLGQIERGFSFSDLALQLVDRFDAPELRAKILLTTYGFTRHWRQPYEEVLPYLVEAYHVGLDAGDVTFAAYAYNTRGAMGTTMGENLEVLQKYIETGQAIFRQLGQLSPLQNGIIRLDYTSRLRGIEGQELVLPNGEVTSSEEMLALFIENNDRLGSLSYYFYDLVYNYLLENWEEAFASAEELKTYADSGQGLSWNVDIKFFDALLRLVRAEKSTGWERMKLLAQVRLNWRQLRIWADHMPQNCSQRVALVAAEWYRVQGKVGAAQKRYEEAIGLAQKHKHVFDEGLAQELAGKFYLGLGRERIARLYLRDARYAYEQWGSGAKVAHLDEKYGRLWQQGAERMTAANSLALSIFASHDDIGQGAGLGALDLATVLKASQTLSREIVLENLLHQVMKIVIENAGAQRGILILKKDGEWVIEAEARVGGDDEAEGVEVLQSLPVANQAQTAVPVAIINYVARTNESVILNDARHEGAFIQDRYVREYQPKSLLCTPLRTQGKVVGVLYLENTLTTGAFPAERIEVLNLLSSQAAISIENASLYDELSDSLAQQVALTKAYSRFVPPEILDLLGRKRITDVQLGDQIEEIMTVMFADIRSFTSLSERMTPAENFRFVNDYLSQVSPVIRQHYGFIDKYIGDEIMALFPRSADDALAAAVALQEAVAAYNIERPEQADIAIGVSLHQGSVMFGTVGEVARMEGTVISDAVNLASRLEKLNKQYGTSIIVSESTLAAAQTREQYHVRFLGQVQVKGKEDFVGIIEVLDGEALPMRALKIKSLPDFEQGMKHYQRGEFAEALFCYEQVLALNPQDVAAKLYRKRALAMQAKEVGGDWEAVELLDEG
ncbi:MAG TPA: AAA family ATPase [Anaerolineae bacterium]|nr:AAA family ATPase [Anaerolineae bacterium]